VFGGASKVTNGTYKAFCSTFSVKQSFITIILKELFQDLAEDKIYMLALHIADCVDKDDGKLADFFKQANFGNLVIRMKPEDYLEVEELE
jgi:hypothetical protein